MSLYDVVVPTYKRPEKLARFFASYVKTRPENTQLFLYFDNRDEESWQAFQKLTDPAGLAKMHTDGELKILIEADQLRAFGIWNFHLSLPSYADGMFYLCDDIELEPDCLARAIAAVEGFQGDGVAGLEQVGMREKAGFARSAMGLIGAKFADRFPDRQCFCPDYISFHADSELGEFARSLGRFAFCEDARIIHYHPAHFPGEMDETHAIVRGENSIQDRATYQARKARNLTWGRTFNRVRP